MEMYKKESTKIVKNKKRNTSKVNILKVQDCVASTEKRLQRLRAPGCSAPNFCEV